MRIPGLPCGTALSHRLLEAICIGSLSLLAAVPAAAQGTFYTIHSVLLTGASQPLLTAAQTFTADSLQPVNQLGFAFGFATEETVAAGQFLDAMTVTLQDARGAATLVYLTADAHGITWAPVTPHCTEL